MISFAEWRRSHWADVCVSNVLHAAGEAADARLLAECERHRLEVETLETRAAHTLEEAAAQALAPPL